MDQQFKKIIQKTKAWNQGETPLSKTFEGALFKESAWPFFFEDSIEIVPEVEVAQFKLEQVPEVLTPVAILNSKSLSLVLFVGDTYAVELGDDLLGKMIQAMKLLPGEYNRLQFKQALDDVEELAQNLVVPSLETNELFQAIEKFKPQIVVTLGATVTNILLGKREKLSGIHGQFFEKSLKLGKEDYIYQVMPIFHPDFLIINPNMKRTAWIDLQKVMERIGKN